MKRKLAWFALGILCVLGIAAAYDPGILLRVWVQDTNDDLAVYVRQIGTNRTQPWLQFDDGDGTMRFQIPPNGILPTQFGGTGNTNGAGSFGGTPGTVLNTTVANAPAKPDASKTNLVAMTGADLNSIGGVTSTTTNTGLAYLSASNQVQVATSAQASNSVSGSYLPLGGGTMAGSINLYSSTTSGLPPANTGSLVWDSDMLTVWGAGSILYSDGSKWYGLVTKVAPTTSVNTFIIECESNAVYAATPITDCSLGTTASGPGLLTSRNSRGNAANSNVINTNGQVSALFNNGSATGSGAFYGLQLVNETNDTYGCGGQYSVYGQSTSASQFFAIAGFSGSSATNYPTSGVFFLYDRFNLTAHNQAYTNDWICVSAKAGTYTFADSGLAPNTSQGASFDRLGVIWGQSGASFYTNGILCATATSTAIPTVNLFANYASMICSVGTGNAILYEVSPWIHWRRANARVY